MNRWSKRLLAGAIALAATSCLGNSDSSVTVLVDYSHDEFATQFMAYFPNQVQVHPGDSITFKQFWTGEPHTVTLGTLLNDVLEIQKPLIAEYGHLPYSEIPEWVLEEYDAAELLLPTFWGEEDEADGRVGQASARPCLVVDGSPPLDGSPCEVQDLPPFTGTEAYYNTGVIPFEGRGANTFNLQLADTIEPGSYPFYCVVHGAFQSGVIEVLPPDQPVPTPAEVREQTRQQVNDIVRPYVTAFQRATGAGEFERDGEVFAGNFSGLAMAEVEGMLNEFIPKDMEVKVNEPVTWLLFGYHSISFNVPEYFPIVEWLDDGTVRINPAIDPPAGGAPEIPEDYTGEEAYDVDAGTWDGKGFWSSGVWWNDDHLRYTLRISEPGTYKYACVIHPPMVGTLKVTR